MDAIGEFKVLGANFPAEYGRTAGSVLKVVYKSGTNNFHGTAYEFFAPLTISATNVAGLFNSHGLADNNGKSAKLSGDVHDRLTRYLDTNVFSRPAAFTFGNTSVTSPDLRATLVRNREISVFKDFVVKEGLRLQFRTEAFTALNAMRFGNPETNRASTDFGVVSTQANSPRQIKFGLKLLF